MKVAIVGGGPSGLYLASLLKARSPAIDIDVLEQNGADSTFGFGVVLADSGLARVEAADPEIYRQLTGLMHFNGEQTIKVREQAVELKHPAAGGAIARIDLLHVLQRVAAQRGVRLHHGQRIEHPDELARYGLQDADIVVGADGANSILRGAFEAEFDTERSALSNHFAWYGTAKVFERSALVFREWQGGSFVAHYYPYSSERSTFVAECDQATWVKLGMEVMDNNTRQALFERVFARELDGHPLISNNSSWRQFPVVRARNWTHGRHVLIGDAQTVAHFSIGSGTRIAMEDAIALAEALSAAPAPGQAEPTPLQRLQNFAHARGPAKDKLLRASRKSYLWYENFGEWMRRYSALEFVHEFMLRTGRMTEPRLAAAYPALMAQWRAAGIVKDGVRPVVT